MRIAAAFIFFLVVAAVAVPSAAERLALVAAEPPAMEDPAGEIVWEERILGDENAPVTIVEYASMTCGHCAAFHELVLPHVKAELIDTGKARLVYRDFPLNAAAVKAATLARCMPAQRYFPFVESVYRSQQSWTLSGDIDGALVKMAGLAGLDETRARACLNHKALELKTVEVMREAQAKYRINSTPTFVFYDDKGNRLKAYKPFTDLMDKHMKDHHHH